MAKDLKKKIIAELDKRIDDLKKHRNDKIKITGNQYEELNQALSHVIGVPLLKELENLKQFVEEQSDD